MSVFDLPGEWRKAAECFDGAHICSEAVCADQLDCALADVRELVEAAWAVLQWSEVLLTGYFPNEGDREYAIEQMDEAHSRLRTALAKFPDRKAKNPLDRA